MVVHSSVRSWRFTIASLSEPEPEPPAQTLKRPADSSGRAILGALLQMRYQQLHSTKDRFHRLKTDWHGENWQGRDPFPGTTIWQDSLVSPNPPRICIFESVIILTLLLVFLSFFRSPTPDAPDHGTSERRSGAEKWPGDAQLQGRGQAGTQDRVVQGWRTGQVYPEPRAAPLGLALLPADRARQEGTGRRCLLVRGHQRRRHGAESERDAADCGWVFVQLEPAAWNMGSQHFLGVHELILLRGISL